MRLDGSARSLPVVLSALLSALLLAGCAVGPDYRRPELPVPAEFRQQPPAGWQPAQARDHEPRGAWWTAYGDPQLSQLVEQALAANPTVAAGEAAVRQARAQLGQTESARFPTLGAGAGVSTSRSGGGSNGGAGTGTGGGAGGSGGVASGETWRLSLDASWEPDLFGRVRRSVEAGQAVVAAGEADHESIRLAVAAQVVATYLDLRTADLQQKLLDDTATAYARSRTLTGNRYQAGVAARVDVVQADVQYKSIQAQRLDAELGRQTLESALAILVGQPPATFRLEPVAGALPTVPVTPLLLPSELLLRRPDVAAAERSVVAANARIGVAEAAWFPSFGLSASASLRAGSLGDLFSSPAWLWSPALSIAQALFDAGLRRSIVDQQRAAWEGQVAGYRQTVLTAFKEVEDNLAALRILESGIALQQETLAATRLLLTLTDNQYQAGVANYLNVITAQTSALSAERSLLDLQRRRLLASVQLVRALGGGWVDPAPTTSP